MSGIRFNETMEGGFVLGETDPETGAKKGQATGEHLALHGTIAVDDIDRFIADPNHLAELSGTIDFTPWGEGIPADSGVFNLFKPTDNSALKLMVYEMAITHRGKPYYLAGRKTVRDDSILELWPQTTTLYTQLHEGEDKSGLVVGSGVLTIGVKRLIKLVSTFEATDANSPAAKTEAISKFGKFFLGELWDSYVRHAPC